MAFLLGWAAQNTKWVSAVKRVGRTLMWIPCESWVVRSTQNAKAGKRNCCSTQKYFGACTDKKKKKKKNVHLSEWTNIQLSRDHNKCFWGPNCTRQGTACWGFQNGHKAALSSSPGIRPQKWGLTWSLSPLLLPPASSSWPGLSFLENSLPKGGG